MNFEFNKLKRIGIDEYNEYLQLINKKESQILNWLINNMYYETLDLIYNTPGYDILTRKINPSDLKLDYLFTLRKECYDIDGNNLYFYSINKRLFSSTFNDVSDEEKCYANCISDKESMNKVSYWQTFRHGISYCVDIPGEYLLLILCRKIRESIIDVDLLDLHLTMNIHDTMDNILDNISSFTKSTSRNLENNFILLDSYVDTLIKKIKDGDVEIDRRILELGEDFIWMPEK